MCTHTRPCCQMRWAWGCQGSWLVSLPLCHLRTVTEMGNVSGDCKKGNITPTFKKWNASPVSLTPCPEIHEANPSRNHDLPNQILLVFTTQRVSDTELFSNCSFIFSLLLFCTSDPAASAFSPLEWCFCVPYLQLQQAQVYIYLRQKYIFHLNLGSQRCWIHSGHCAFRGVKDLPLLEVTLGMKSVVEEEHGVSMCSFV